MFVDAAGGGSEMVKMIPATAIRFPILIDDDLLGHFLYRTRGPGTRQLACGGSWGGVRRRGDSKEISDGTNEKGSRGARGVFIPIAEPARVPGVYPYSRGRLAGAEFF